MKYCYKALEPFGELRGHFCCSSDCYGCYFESEINFENKIEIDCECLVLWEEEEIYE